MTKEEEIAKDIFVSFIARMICKYGFLTDDETEISTDSDDSDYTIDNR